MIDHYQSARRLWWLPSLSQFIWLAFFLGLILTQWRLVLISADGDACWHWQMGNWMIEHRAIIRHDLFSHTRFGAPLVTKEWLSEVFFAAAGNALGWNGIVFVAAVVVATMLWLLHCQLLAEGNEILLATLLVLLAATGCASHWLARPHLFTMLFVVVFAWKLRWYDRGHVSARQLFVWLVPLTVLWTNLHGGFLTGITLIGLYFIGSAMDRWAGGAARHNTAGRKMLTFGLLGVACGLTTLLNPAGWKLHQHILSFLHTPYQMYFTDEWCAASLHSKGMLGFALQLLVLAAILIWLRPQLSWTDVLLIAFWGYSGLQAVRNLPIFALIATPILAEHLNAAQRGTTNGRWLPLYHKVSLDINAVNRASGCGSLIAGAVAAILLVLAKPVAFGGPALVETEILTNRFPVTAVANLRKHAEWLNGNMFNDYGWGGYLVRYMPEYRVFIDGRNDFYGEPFLREFSEVFYLQPGWEGVLDKYGVGWTILPRAHALNNLLALSTNWHCIYTDQVAIVYSRDVHGP